MRTFTYDEVVSAVKGVSLSGLSIQQMEYLLDLLKVKAGVVDKEIHSRKLRGKD